MTSLFISEYGEGAGVCNGFLEIYNPSSVTVSLADHAFASVGNAPQNPGTHEYWHSFPAGASIAPGGVYVVCRAASFSFAPYTCNVAATILSACDFWTVSDSNLQPLSLFLSLRSKPSDEFC